MTTGASTWPVYAYARISRDPDLTSEAIDRQVADNHQLAARLGWSEPVDLIDRNRSAWKKSGSRPAFRQLLEVLSTGRASGVIVWNIDRLLRRADELEQLIAAVESHPVPIHSAAGEIDLSTADGRLVARIMVAVAQKESDDKSRRIRRALVGKPRPSSQLPYGQTADQVAVIQEAARRVIDGETYHGICRDFTARGIPTPRASTAWSQVSLRKILANPATATHLSSRAFIDLQRIIEQRAAVSPRRVSTVDPHDYLLSGLLHCQPCGGRMVGRRTNNGTAKYQAVDCHHSISPAERVEAVVLAWLQDQVERDILRVRAADPSDTHLADRLAELDEAYWIHRQLDRATYDRLRDQLSTQMTARPARLEPATDQWATRFVTASPASRRQMIRQAIERVDVAPAVRGRKFDPTRLTIRTSALPL